ncbi:hypothetical protein BDW62DRAFT_157186 [Aspergillus aurantiobrunneus]
MENMRNDSIHFPGSSPRHPQVQEETNGQPTVGAVDRMLEHSQVSQIGAGHSEQTSQTGQPQSRNSHSSQQSQRTQNLQEQITQNLAGLEEARQSLRDTAQHLERHLREHQMQERHQRLRRRLRRRQQRRLSQRIQGHLQRAGLDIQISRLPLPQGNHQTSEPASLAPEVHPDFHNTISLLSRKLHPLVSNTTGRTHPDFPRTLLSFNLLTSQQLNSLALHFHQVYPPKRESFRYPLPIKPWLATNGLVRDLGVDTEVKRRRFGRFIGLRGCESPVAEREEGSKGGNGKESLIEQVERDWERRFRIVQAAEEEKLRRMMPARFLPGR